MNTSVHSDAQGCRRSGSFRSWLYLGVVILTLGVGCSSPRPTPLSEVERTPFRSVKLREGDQLKITVVANQNLNTQQEVRRDGKITLVLGEVQAAGRTPAELEKELLKLYESQLVSKEVTVSLEKSTYPVFVSGAVMKPGKILAERPMSALEAIMEAGGFDLANANPKAVTVIRNEEGQLRHFVLNLKAVLEGRSTQSFYVRPDDIIHVPEKAL